MKSPGKAFLGYIGAIKLSTKLTALMLVFMLVPMVCLIELHLVEVRRALIDKEETLAQQALRDSLTQAEEVILACERAAGTVLGNRAMIEALDPDRPEKLRQDQVLELVDPLIKVAAGNPNLRSIRLFANDNRITELVPVFLSFEHMKLQPWYTLPFPGNNTWKFSAAPGVFPVMEGDGPYAVYLNELRYADGSTFGMLEVSAPLGTLFREMYGLPENQWMGFVDASGSLYYDRQGVAGVWSGAVGSVVYAGAEQGGRGSSILLKQGGNTILVSSVPVPALTGRLIRAVLLDREVARISRLHVGSYLCALVFTVAAAAVMNRAVRHTLGRLYTLMKIAREVQRGNLGVNVPAMGRDEIGEFASDFRETIDRVSDLMETGINRELLVKTTELRALQSQINAHFVYNVLESIKMMAEIDAKYEISDAVTALGELLHYSMRWASPVVDLGEELHYIREYLTLINLRYDFTITLALDIPQALLGQKIPKMSLQPIVENAVVHGIEELDQDAAIRIKGKEGQGYFEIEITDTGKGMDSDTLKALEKQVYGACKADPPRHGGIGLRNVQERIQLRFGSAYGLRLYAMPHCYTKVVVKLPLEPQPSEKEAHHE